MGKKGGTNKGKKLNNVFKVAGARSLKIKNKAQPVAAQLKKLKGGDLVNEMNREFSNLQEKVRQQGTLKAAAEAAAKQAKVFSGIRQAESKRRKNAALRQKVQNDIDKISDLMIK